MRTVSVSFGQTWSGSSTKDDWLVGGGIETRAQKSASLEVPFMLVRECTPSADRYLAFTIHQRLSSCILSMFALTSNTIAFAYNIEDSMGALLLLLLLVMVLATIILLRFTWFGEVISHEPSHLRRLLLRPFVIRDLRPEFAVVKA